MTAHALRDRHLKRWRVPKTHLGRSLVEALTTAALAARTAATGETPKLRADHRRRLETTLGAIAAEGVLALSDPPATGRIALALNYRNGPKRFRPDGFGEGTGKLLETLYRLDLFDFRRGQRHGEASTIAPRPAFSALVERMGVTMADFGLSETRGDPLVLTRKTHHGRTVKKRLVDYPEDETTERLRAEMVWINHHHRTADIAFIPDGLGHVDVDDRYLSRRFTVPDADPITWDRCGRVFGGFYQGLRKDRRAGLRIDGEPTVNLDYSAAFTHIAMAEQGIAPTGKDPYAIPGLEGLGRDRIKRAINIFFFASPAMRKWPDKDEETEAEGNGDGENPIRPLHIPPEWTPMAVRSAVLARHPYLVDAMSNRGGYRLMWKESRIMVRLLLRLTEEGITALPLHDALIVGVSHASRARTLMEEVSREEVGMAIPLKATFYEAL